MARTIREEFGEMPCVDAECESHAKNRPVVVYKTDKGALSFSCDKCGTKIYAFPHEKNYTLWMRRMGKTAPEAAPEKPAQAAHEKRVRATIFG